MESLLDTTRLAHTLITKHIQIEDFDTLFAQVNDQVSLAGVGGRIQLHTLNELMHDVIPNYCYNSTTRRFLKSPVFYAEPIIRPHFPKAKLMYLYGEKSLSIQYALHFSIYKEYIGQEHFESLLQIAGDHVLALLRVEAKEHINLLFPHALSNMNTRVLPALPASLQLPVVDYGIEGMHDYFAVLCKNLLSLAELKSDIIQTFKEIGNSLLLVSEFSNTMVSDLTRPQKISKHIFHAMRL